MQLITGKRLGLPHGFDSNGFTIVPSNTQELCRTLGVKMVALIVQNKMIGGSIRVNKVRGGLFVKGCKRAGTKVVSVLDWA